MTRHVLGTLAAVALLGCHAHPPAARQAPAAAAVAPVDTVPRVLVGARELRVEIPIDDRARAAWDTLRRGRYPGMRWAFGIEAVTGGRGLTVEIRGDSARLAAASLETALARMSVLVVCAPGGMMVICDFGPKRSTIRLRDGVLVVRYRDQRQIADLFGLRPSHVSYHAPGDDGTRPRSLRVRYVAPGVPMPTRALRDSAAAIRARRERASRRSYTIVEAGGWRRRSWIEIGDSLPLRLVHYECRYDACSGSTVQPGRGWMLSDSALADLTTRTDSVRVGQRYWVTEARTHLVARRPGRLVVSIRDPGGESDAMVTDTVDVVPPLASLRLEAVRDRNARDVGGLLYVFHVVARDAAGTRIAAPPTTLRVDGGCTETLHDSSSVHYLAPGAHVAVARFRAFTDTLRFTVPPGPSPRRRWWRRS